MRMRSGLALCAAVLVALAAHDVWQLARIHAWNVLIESPRGEPVPDDAPPPVHFARAYALAQRDEVLAALAQYRQVVGTDKGRLRAAALFNEGNLLLREALTLRATAEPSQALPVFEMAKESFRELLAEHANDWDAKYSLELALRLAPDPDEDESARLPPAIGAPRQAPARGSNPGLP